MSICPKNEIDVWNKSTTSSGAARRGRARLRVLSRVMRPTTLSLLDRAGIRPGMECLEVGCGSGDLAFDLAQMVGAGGRVVATDVDEIKLRLARQEALSEEELAIFDLLTRPEPALSTEEREEVKKVARQLLARIHSLLGLDWRNKNQSRARVRMAIEDTLYSLHHELPDKYPILGSETADNQSTAVASKDMQKWLGWPLIHFTNAL
jgi:SAM-dependent methyltransferase